MPSAVACAESPASSPPMPAPCAMTAARFAPNCRRRRATPPETERTTSVLNLSRLPSPAMTTRLAGSLPNVWMVAVSPLLAGYLLVRDERGDGAVQRAVHSACPAARGRYSLEQVDDDGVCVGLSDVALLNSHGGHVALPLLVGVALAYHRAQERMRRY